MRMPQGTQEGKIYFNCFQKMPALKQEECKVGCNKMQNGPDKIIRLFRKNPTLQLAGVTTRDSLKEYLKQPLKGEKQEYVNTEQKKQTICRVV